MSPEPSPTSVAVAFCPHPPLLLPGLGGTAGVETDRLRVACGEALQTVLGLRPDVVLVVGEGPAGVRYGVGDAADLALWGGAGRLPFAGRVRPGGRPLPLPHAVGARLLDEAGYAGTRLGVAPADLPAALDDLPGPVGVLAMADGSARRTPTAPGALDPVAGGVDPVTEGLDVAEGVDVAEGLDAARGFDAAVAEALERADPAALAALDVVEGRRLLAAGVGTWAAVGAALTGRSATGRLLLDEAPSGVGYLVADWVLAGVPDGVPGWLQR